MRTTQNTRITDHDAARLARLVEDLLRHASTAGNGAEALYDTLDSARIVPSAEIEDDVVTMNSEVTIEDLPSGSRQAVRLVYPHDSNPGEGRVSVLSPLGNAILGARAGDEVQFVTPLGERGVRIAGIRFQPEAAGQFDL